MENFVVKTIKEAAFSMDYCAFGTGLRPLVVLPGMSVRPVIASAKEFAAAYQCFAMTHSVYLFDRTRKMPEGYRVSDMARDTICAMHLLGLADADLFGASQGGMLAQCIAVQAPELVHKLVLGSTLARPNAISNETFDTWTALACSGDVRSLNRDVVQRVYCEQTRLAMREVFTAAACCGTQEDLRRFAILSQASRTFDEYEQLSRISCPVLVLGAKADRVLSGGASVEIAQKLQCPYYLYSEFGHAVYDEAPDYKKRLLAFF